jgi:hypothetical protein
MADRADRHIISCATVAEELRQLGVTEDELTVLEFGLHVYPEELTKRLQEAIDAVEGDCDILLGYGLCSYAVVGLRSESHRLVIPVIDDCIALFLGSRDEHKLMLATEPGTYFLTKGWVEAQEGALTEYVRIRDRYGEERALKVARAMFGNYTRVALINTGNYRIDDYREFGRAMAEFLELSFEELPGSNRMLLKMLDGDWGEEFLVVPAGEPVPLDPFT